MQVRLGNSKFVAIFFGLGVIFANTTLVWAQGGSMTLGGCTSGGLPCPTYTLSDNESWDTITINATRPTAKANGSTWPILSLGDNALTINTSLIITNAGTTRPRYEIDGGDGELIIGQGAKFLYDNYSSYSSTRQQRITLDKLNLFGEFTIDRNTADNANNFTRINSITFNPGASMNMLHASYITTNNSRSTYTGSLPLETLEIIGHGGDGSLAANTAIYKATPLVVGDPTLGRSLHTEALVVNLLDTGTFGSDSVLFHFDNSDLASSDLGISGLTPTGTPGQGYIQFKLGIVDENGNESTLKADQTPGSTFTLVDKISNSVNTSRQASQFNLDHIFDAGPYLDMTLKTFLDESLGIDNLSLKGTWGGYNADKSRPLLEGMMANAVALQNGADLLTESGISNALMLADSRYGEQGFGLFSSFAGYSQKISTGSHIDYRGFSFVGGPAVNYDTPYGHLLLGAFLEGGTGSYDTTSYFKIRDNVGKPIGKYGVSGDGDNDYLGGGLLIRHDFNPGYYAEASVRGGRISNDFSSSDMGPGVKYSADGNYLGLHGGLGYRYEYKPGLMINAYGKVYWTKIGGDSLTTKDGMTVDFDDAEFLRTRLGVRYTAPLTDSLGLNVGGAWDYNFGGDNNYGSYKGKVGSYKTPIAPGGEPTLKGSSGILELGLEYKPFEDTGLSLALSGKAYLGQVEGGSGTLLLKYVFGGSNESSSSEVKRNGNPPSFGDPSGTSSFLSGHLTASRSMSGPIMVAQSAAGESDNAADESASVTLETVTVYSDPQWKQVLSPGTISVVVPDDYKGEQKSLGDLLDTVPGLHVNKRGGSGQYTTVNVRGSTSAQVGIYVDGVPQNLGGDSAVDISLYTSENVARIEVYKGYVPVRFTGAPIGGVINIVTKKPVDQSTTVSVGARSNGGFQANGLFTTPLLGGSLLFSATRDQSDGDFKYKYWQADVKHSQNPQPPEAYITDRRRMNNSHQKTDVMAKWQTEHLSIQGSWKEMDRYYPWTTQVAAANNNPFLVDIDSDPWELNRRNNQQVIERDLVVGYRNDWNDLNWGLEFDYKKQVKNFRWEDGPASHQQGYDPTPGMLWSVYDTDRWGVTLDASYKLGENNMLEFRGNFADEQLKMDGSEWAHPQIDSLNTIKMASQYEQKITNLQLQDTITMDDDLWLTLILRANRVQADGIDGTRYQTGVPDPLASDYSKGFATDDGNWNYTWGVALKKNLDENWTFKATGGTFVRYPNFYELFGDGVYIKPAIFTAQNGATGVPVPEPEKGEQWDFTVEWNGDIPWLETPGNLSATYFTRRTENMIGLFQTPSFVYYGNYGKTRASGVELEAGLKSTYVDLNFSATWLESEIIDLAKFDGGTRYSVWFSEGHEILNSPQWETNLRGDFRLPWVDGLTIFAEHHFTDKVPIASISNTGMRYEDALQTVNLGFRAEILDGLMLTAGVNDVFNKSIEQGFYDSVSHGNVYKGETSTLFFPKEGRVFYGTLQYTF